MWALLFLLTVNIAAAAVTITGSVVDETGNPVAGARVTAEASDTASVAATTDAAGVFRFDLAAAGDYQLRVAREGFFLLTTKSPASTPAHPSKSI